MNLGVVSLTETNNTSFQTTYPIDNESASFVHYTAAQLAANGFEQSPPLGSCVVSIFTGISVPSTQLITTNPLNAGPLINLNGPAGDLTLYPASQGLYTGPTPSPDIVPADGGMFFFDDGLGGSDVGEFATSLPVNLDSPFVWTNISAVMGAGVTRADGQLITWSGGPPMGFVSINGASFYTVNAGNPAQDPNVGASFSCSAWAPDGQFMIPSSVLASLPASYSLYPTSNNFLSVGNGFFQQFSAPGLDLGVSFFSVANWIKTSYQ